MPDDGFIEKHANRVGLDPRWLRKVMQVESGGNPNAVTGSYHGLFQLDKAEFRRHGGTGDIHDPEQNTMAAANKIAEQKLRFEQKHDRPATLRDIYMIHQQGEAGYNAHLSNPDAPAWQNEMRASGRSESWAKRAIWGNMTTAMKDKYGSVENVSSANFVGDWGQRIEGVKPSTSMARARTRREGIPEEVGAETKPQPQPQQVAEQPFQMPYVPEVTIRAPQAPDIQLRRARQA